MSTQQDRVKQTGLIGHYIPAKMFVALGVFLAFIGYMRDDLYVRFMAHPSLNALIIGTMCIALGLVFVNIFNIQAAANLLRRLEEYEDNPGEDEKLAILKKLRTKNCIINTFYMEGAILALKESGALAFNDNQSRIMKGKVGQRTTRMRHSVQYLAGVLVMLGLIGTFWGLLETITSVGEAMAEIVNAFSESGSDGGGGSSMVEFLKAISKPLQGMGIAFSASLFGLSGSLMAGLLNSFCAKGINSFLEDFSNWIDARIPPPAEKKRAPELEGLNAVELIEHHNQMVIEALQQALNGLAQQQQQMFGMFSGLINEMTQFNTQQAALTRVLAGEKRDTMRIAGSLEDAVGTLNNNLGHIRESLSYLPTATREMRDDVRSLSSSMLNTQQQLLSQQQLAGEQLKESARQHAEIYHNLGTLFDGTHSMKILHAQIVEVIEHLHDDTLQQKDKMIELVMVMQHILQTQSNPALSLNSNPMLDTNKDI